MKNTFITLASVATLASAANAQTIETVRLAGADYSGSLGTLTTSTGDWTIGNSAPTSSTGNIHLDDYTSGTTLLFASWTANVDGVVDLGSIRALNVSDATGLNIGGSFWAGGSNLSGNLITADNTWMVFDQTGSIAINAGETVNFNIWSSSNNPNNEVAIASSFRFTTVPEPSSTALLGLGALGLLVRRKR